MGLHKDYSSFIVLGLVASFGFYEMVGRISSFLVDLNGDRSISYLLILPLSPFLTLSSMVVGWSCSGVCLTLLLFPVAKILLGSQWDVSSLAFGKFLFMVLSINLMFGYFSLWLASLIKNVKNTGWLWIMIINPLYMLGGYYCPWKVMYKISYKMGILCLLNPITYVMDGIRSTTLGPNDFLNYWICLGALWLYIPFFSWHSYCRIKRKLDFI